MIRTRKKQLKRRWEREGNETTTTKHRKQAGKAKRIDFIGRTHLCPGFAE